MSLVGPPDMSTASYGNRNICSLKGGNNSYQCPSQQIYGSDKHKLFYAADSFRGEGGQDPKYFLDSPSEELVHPSSAGAADAQFRDSSFMARKNNQSSYPPNFNSDFSATQSPESVDFEQEKIRLKLQELEHALLDDVDEDEDFVLGSDLAMELERDWTHPMQDLMLHDSPKESSSMDSNVSSISCNREVSLLPLPRTDALKQLLFDCARAISQENFSEASTMINDLRQMVSMQGEPSERIAAYMVEGLAARLASSGKILYKALKCKEPPSSDRLAAMQILFEGCPCFKFGFMAANGAIIEAIRGEKKAHIIDFDINQGNQYITLIQSLSNLPRHKLPEIRLSGVDDPESVQRAVGGIKNIGQRLEMLAEAFGVPFKFEAIPAKTSALTPAMLLGCKPAEDEVLVVNFAFQLHHMPDESVSTVNQRDQLLRMVKGLNPKLVTVVEQDVNTNTTPFLTRFVEAYNYYYAVFDSLDVTFVRESQDRVNVEKQCLARDIVNIIACEGEERIERYEVAGKWRARMTMAGFSSCPISRNVSGAIRTLMKQYSERYKLREETTGSLGFGWDEKNLIVSSAWK